MSKRPPSPIRQSYFPPAPSRTSFPIAAQPRRQVFDAWNSSSTGHQRAENRLAGSTSWRDSRSAKLSVQFAAGRGGGERVADAVGAGSVDFERLREQGRIGYVNRPCDRRERKQRVLQEWIDVEPEEEQDEKRGTKRRRVEYEDFIIPDVSIKIETESGEKKDTYIKDEEEEDRGVPTATPENVTAEDTLDQSPADFLSPIYSSTDSTCPSQSASQTQLGQQEKVCDDKDADLHDGVKEEVVMTTPPQIFQGLTIYINGSTYPLISDHKLKHLLVTHGANLSITPARRTVSHIILGVNISTKSSHRSDNNDSHDDTTALNKAGGGLAASKIHKEIEKVRLAAGKGVKYVSAEWVVECVKVGKRLAESRFEVLKTGPVNVKGVGSIFSKSNVKKDI